MNILVFFAHPDDETMLAGGVLALLARAGAQVHYLSATRGEGGEVGEPPLASPERLGEVREAELVCAVRALGGKSLTFLDYVDPRVGPEETLYAYEADLTMLSGQVAATLRQFDIDVILTHGVNGEYGHPAHVLTHAAARVAVEARRQENPGEDLFFYTVGASFPEHPRPRLTNADNPAHLIVDISTALAEKTRAALCHRTQHALFVRRSSQEAGRRLTVPEVVERIRLEGLHRVSPPVEDEFPRDGLRELLAPWLWERPE